MDINTENFVSMLGKLAAYFANHATTITGVLPIFPSQRTIFDTKRAAIIDAVVEASTDITGHALDKAIAQEAVISSALKVGLAAAGYYTVTMPSNKNRTIVDWSRSELDKMRDNDLYVAVLKGWKVADPVKALLVPFGATSADVDELATRLDAFFEILDSPKEMIDERSGHILNLNRGVDDMRKFLTETLDVIFSPLQVSQPLIYDTYQACRGIDDAAGGAGGIIIAFVDPAQVKKVDTGTAINSDTIVISFTNRTSVMAEPLSVFFQTAAYALGDPLTTSPQTVAPGGTFTLTAGELGYSPSHHVLHVQNGDGSLPQSFRIEIG